MTTHKAHRDIETLSEKDSTFMISEERPTELEAYLDVLYNRPVVSTRGGSIFNAHSYPTKINAAAIVPFILVHTKPGDVLFDGFSGSGATGLAVSLCNNSSINLQRSVETMLGKVNWGTRNCILYDISELATFTSSMLLDPPDPLLFLKAAKEVLQVLINDWGWMYAASDKHSSPGTVRYILWTDYVICPHCNTTSSFWDLAVCLSPLQIASSVTCPGCQQDFGVASAKRLAETYYDDLLHEQRKRRKRTPAFVYGRTARAFWKRSATEADSELIERINSMPIPTSVPVIPMLVGDKERWGELYRSGYHFGMTHLHHFYTRRNLIAIAAALQVAQAYPEKIRDALRFWISSYNSSHSTLMTRVVCKENADDFVVTSAQPATLYISSLPVEKNVFAGLRTKLKPIVSAFQEMQNRSSTVTVHCASSLKVDLPEASVDYIFTDPPFGDNIQYSEVNFINEAWFGKTTRAEEEVIISQYQGKTVEKYQLLLTGAFTEAFRILKPGHYMTVIFHSTRPAIWNALRSAWETAGFQMIRSSVLNKTQASFKQVTTEGAVRGDPVILLQKPFGPNQNKQRVSIEAASEQETEDPWKVVQDRLLALNQGPGADSFERTRQRLYSHLITYYLERGQSIPLNSNSFFTGLVTHFQQRGEYYYLPEE